MIETKNDLTGLASILESRLVDWEKARKPQELKLLECYQDVMRIAREDDTSGTGASKARKAKSIFVGSTRNKVRSARAKIVDSLFGGGIMPFDTTPTNEKLAPYADAVEKILTEQMERGDFKALLKTGVNTLATYGTGFIFGPFVRKESITETTAQQIGPSTSIEEVKHEYDFPYFELGNTLDVYPDPESRTIEGGLGVFWVTMESSSLVKSWKSDDSYKNIDEALVCLGGERLGQNGAELAAQLRGNVLYWHKNERIKVARFFGKVPRSALEDNELDDAKETEAEERAESDLVDVIVIMAGGVVVKVVENPYSGKCPAYRCVYEDVEHEMWGVGVAENNMPHQKITNAAFRLVMEGKGMALLGTATVDRSMFLPTEDFKKFPGKVYQTKPGLSPDERDKAIMHHVEPDITGGWLDIIRMSEQFSDDDTGITKYTQGDDSGNLNKTAHGISMIMAAGSLPMKEVLQNIDSMWIEEIVEQYIMWNLKYLEPETVQKIHGDEVAAIWAQIKQFGKSSFMDWQATGVSSFMQKEILTNKIRAFADFVLSNPLTASKIDVTELLNQTWDVMEIGRESPILKPEGQEALPPEVQQQMQQMQQHVQQMDTAIQGMTAEAEKKDQELAALQQKLAKAELDLHREQVISNIKDAQQTASQVPSQQTEANEPAQPQQPMIMPDVNGQLVGAIAPMLETINQSVSSTSQALAAIHEGQQILIQEMAQDREQSKAVLMEMMRPKISTIEVTKQANGKFVGQKTEQ